MFGKTSLWSSNGSISTSASATRRCRAMASLHFLTTVSCEHPSSALFFLNKILLISIDYSTSPCLAERLNDQGGSHSPLYGFGKDGFPIYGPYQEADTLAVSCWQKRDYLFSSPTGCPCAVGLTSCAASRSCLLKNPLDYTQGTRTGATLFGPSLTGTVTSLSGNAISSASGVFIQDYFFNAS